MSKYTEAGWDRDLPDLQLNRFNHGCSYYDNDDGVKEDIDIIILLRAHHFIQTFLVTGGKTNYGPNPHRASTELLVGTASTWVFAGELPSPRTGVRGANIDNKVLMTGK